MQKTKLISLFFTNRFNPSILVSLLLGAVSGCGLTNTSADTSANKEVSTTVKKVVTQPLVTNVYTADPSAHVFNDRMYIYTSHDLVTDIAPNNAGDHFAMEDYRILSFGKDVKTVTDHGSVLHLSTIPWVGRQMWAPDAAEKDGKYYLYFPAKDKQDIFRMGVATANDPAGPFIAQPEPMKGSFSIDPSVFEDDGEYYFYFGGIWGGQLQNWNTGKYRKTEVYPNENQAAYGPKIAKLTDNMLEMAETPKDIKIFDKDGTPILQKDNQRRFFEAAWVHKYQGTYYLSYSTGDTHNIAYATGDNPYGPFTYQGIILKPVVGWTNHHSVVKFNSKWYLLYHDSSLSGGQTHLRSVKMAELTHLSDGSIQTLDAMVVD